MRRAKKRGIDVQRAIDALMGDEKQTGGGGKRKKHGGPSLWPIMRSKIYNNQIIKFKHFDVKNILYEEYCGFIYGIILLTTKK